MKAKSISAMLLAVITTAAACTGCGVQPESDSSSSKAESLAASASASSLTAYTGDGTAMSAAARRAKTGAIRTKSRKTENQGVTRRRLKLKIRAFIRHFLLSGRGEA